MRTAAAGARLRRVLRSSDLLLLAVASTGPAFSLATTFGPMVEDGGSATPLTLLTIAAIMALIALGYRRLGASYPSAGSSYSWVRAAFGPTAGAYTAWVLAVGNIFAIVATAVPAGAYTLALLAPAHAGSARADAVVGTLWVLAAGALLLAGLRPTARVANALVIAELVVLAATTVAAFVHPAARTPAAADPVPAMPGLLGALLIGVWMVDGWEISASTAEEAATDTTGPGFGGLAGLGLSALSMGIAMVAFLRIGTAAGFSSHEGDALAYVAGELGGPVWGTVVTVTVLVSLAASLQTSLVYMTRSMFAMGRDGVLPLRFGGLDGRAQPASAIVVLTAIGMAGTLGSAFSGGLRAAFAFILSGTSVFLGLLFILSAAAAVRLFAGDRSARLDGVAAPGVGAAVLTVIVAAAVWRADPPTRLFVLAAAGIGVPIAVWGGRAMARDV